jgi:hypothetical protein
LIYFHYFSLSRLILVIASMEILVISFFDPIRSYLVYISNVYAMHSLKFPILHNRNQGLHKDVFRKVKHLKLLYF